MPLWDVVWAIVVAFVVVAQLMVMFISSATCSVTGTLPVLVKAIWILALVALPILTALVHLVVRGPGMAERSERAASAMRQAQDAYIREAAGRTTPADQIAQARAMLDSGVIDQSEYERLKEKAHV